jgi:hypothetical protein
VAIVGCSDRLATKNPAVAKKAANRRPFRRSYRMQRPFLRGLSLCEIG